MQNTTLILITLATATAVLRLKQNAKYNIDIDYISYCYGGIETIYLASIFCFRYLITLATATAVLKHYNKTEVISE